MGRTYIADSELKPIFDLESLVPQNRFLDILIDPIRSLEYAFTNISIIEGQKVKHITYTAKDDNSALSFLKQQDVNTNLFYYLVKTPFKTIGKDIQGYFEYEDIGIVIEGKNTSEDYFIANCIRELIRACQARYVLQISSYNFAVMEICKYLSMNLNKRVLGYIIGILKLNASDKSFNAVQKAWSTPYA